MNALKMPKYLMTIYEKLNYLGKFYDCNNFIHYPIYKGDSGHMTSQNDPPGMWHLAR